MLTETEVRQLREVINQVWGYVAGDMFRDDNGEPDYSLTFSRDEVVEICLDADRWRLVSDTPETEKLVHKFLNLPDGEYFAEIKRICPIELWGY